MKNFFSVLESKKFEIIDVTLRDGGYLNQWSFNKEKLFKWVNFLTSLPISIIELGYISDSFPYKENGTLRPQTLEILQPLRKDHRYAVMLFQEEREPILTLERRMGLFDIVRIPIRIEDLSRNIYLLEYCHENRIQFSINFTKVSAYSLDEILLAVKQVELLQPSIIYLADSRGAILPYQVEEIYLKLADSYPHLKFGFHAHNNLSFALLNSLVALSSGANFIDASIMGSGLGAGNLVLEQLLFLIYNCDRQRLVDIYKSLGSYSHLYSDFAQDFNKVKFYLSGAMNFAQETAQKIQTLEEVIVFASRDSV
jgi:4-hydroxy 2-oxovalerate aldolase